MSAARPEVPAGPVEAAPRGFVPEGERAEILAGVLAGIEMGAWDRRIAAWLAGWDAGAVVTIASWIERSRTARGPG